MKRSAVEALLREAERPDTRTLRVLSRLEAASRRYDVSVNRLERAVKQLEEQSEEQHGGNNAEED